MNTFYHLSPHSEAVAIIASFDRRATPFTGKFFSPKPPDSFGIRESAYPRVCVAPAVWQCLFSAFLMLDERMRQGGATSLCIYSLQCSNAIRHDSGRIEDIDATCESWITNELITQNGGEIDLHKNGDLHESSAHYSKIYGWMLRQGKLVTDFKALSDGELWDDDWILRLP